jgi:hypothetical protein
LYGAHERRIERGEDRRQEIENRKERERREER